MPLPGLFDHVYATYCPPGRDPRYAQGSGQRGLRQVVGTVSALERKGHVGEPALMPRDLRDGVARLLPHRVPLSHVCDVEPAPPEAGQVLIGGQHFGIGGGCNWRISRIAQQPSARRDQSVG